MRLKILPENIHTESLYTNHNTFHEGDSGLDLFFTEDVNVEAKTTKLISLNIAL